MAKALLISTADIAQFTALNGNVAVDDFIQFLNIAQDLDVQSYLGTDLLEVIQAQIIATGAPTGDYTALVTDYIKPMLIHFAMAQYLPWAAYTIGNNGVFKHSSENSETVSKSEVDAMIDRELTIAKNYADLFVKHMCFNSATFPEYNTNSNGDVYPQKDVSFTNWNI